MRIPEYTHPRRASPGLPGGARRPKAAPAADDYVYSLMPVGGEMAYTSLSTWYCIFMLARIAGENSTLSV